MITIYGGKSNSDSRESIPLSIHIIAELVVPSFLFPENGLIYLALVKQWHFEVSNSSRKLRRELINQGEFINCLQIQNRYGFYSAPGLFRFFRRERSFCSIALEIKKIDLLYYLFCEDKRLVMLLVSCSLLLIFITVVRLFPYNRSKGALVCFPKETIHSKN